MKRLLRITEEWAVDTENEAQDIIETAADSGGDLTKKTIEVKQKKSKGQVIEEHLKVTTQVVHDTIWLPKEETEE